MKYLRNHWYDIGLIPMTAAIIFLIASWPKLAVLQKRRMHWACASRMRCWRKVRGY